MQVEPLTIGDLVRSRARPRGAYACASEHKSFLLRWPPSILQEAAVRVVIDTNRLESDELEIFLSTRRTNLAVLPEHTLPELFKAGSLDAVFASYSLLTKYQSQVLVLVPNRVAAGVPGSVAAISNRLIDRTVTRSFPKFCAILKEAQAGHSSLSDQLRERQHWARERANAIEAALGDQSEALEQISAQFHPADLHRFRVGDALTDHARAVILDMTNELARSLAFGPKGKTRLERRPYCYNQFAWRYALCHLVQLLTLPQKGASRRKPEKARNDHFDNVFAVYGTYFNGLMTMDLGSMSTQGIARIILRSLGVRLADDYLDDGYFLKLLDEYDGNRP